MLIITRHIWRNIIENKSRSLLIVFSLMMATLVMYLNLTVCDDLLTQYEAVLRGSYQDLDIHVSKSLNEGDTDISFRLDDLELSGIQAVGCIGLSRELGVYPYKDYQINVYLYGGDLTLLQEKNLVVLKETTASYLEPGHVTVSKNASEYYGLSLGDEFILQTNEGEKLLTVGAIAEIKGMYLQESGRIMMFTSDKSVQEGNSIYAAYIDLQDSADLDSSIERLMEDNRGFSALKLVDNRSVQASLSTMRQMLLYILVGVSIIALYINKCIVKIVLAKRFSVVGTLRSVGASKRFMHAVLIAENVMYSLLGGFLGILAGIALRKPVLSMMSAYAGRADALNIRYKPNVRYIVISVLFTVLLQFLVAVFEIAKSSRSSIKDMMFNNISTGYRLSKKTTAAGFCLIILSIALFAINRQYRFVPAVLCFFTSIMGFVCLIPLLIMGISKTLETICRGINLPTAQLAGKNLKSSKSIIASVTLITTVLSVMMTIILLVYSINSVFTGIKTTFTGDIQLQGLRYPAKEYRELEQLQGVGAVDYIYYSFHDVTLNDETVNIGIFGFDKEQNGITDLSGKISRLSEGEALIDEYYGMRHDIGLGDNITVSNQKLGALELTVVGFVDAGSFISTRNALVISKEQYINAISPIPCAISVKSDYDDVALLKKELTEKLIGTGIGIQTIDEFLASNKSEIDSILLLVAVIIFMAVLLGIMGIVSNQLIGFLQRKKELAIYYSVAMSRMQLVKTFLFELLYTFLSGCLLGALLGVWLSGVLEQILYSIGEYIKIQVNIPLIVAAAFGMFVMILIANLFLLRKLSGLNIVNEIKCE